MSLQPVHTRLLSQHDIEDSIDSRTIAYTLTGIHYTGFLRWITNTKQMSNTSSEYRILVCISLDNDMLSNREAWLTSSRSICESTNFIPNLEINCMSLNTLVLGNYTDDERNTDLRYQYDKTGSKQDAAALSQIT